MRAWLLWSVAAALLLLLVPAVRASETTAYASAELVDSLESEVYGLKAQDYTLTPLEQSLYNDFLQEQEQERIMMEMEAEAETAAEAEAETEVDAEAEAETEAEAEADAAADPKLVKPTVQEGVQGLVEEVPAPLPLPNVAPCPNKTEELKKLTDALLSGAVVPPVVTSFVELETEVEAEPKLVKPVLQEGVVGLPEELPTPQPQPNLAPCPNKTEEIMKLLGQNPILMEVEAESDADVDTETEAEAETEMEDASEAESEMEAEAESESEVESEAEAEAEAEAEVDAENDAETVAEGTMAAVAELQEELDVASSALLEAESTDAKVASTAATSSAAPTSGPTHKINVRVETTVSHAGADNLIRVENSFDSLHSRVMRRLNRLMSRIDRHVHSIDPTEADFKFNLSDKDAKEMEAKEAQEEAAKDAKIQAMEAKIKAMEAKNKK